MGWNPNNPLKTNKRHTRQMRRAKERRQRNSQQWAVEPNTHWGCAGIIGILVVLITCVVWRSL